VAKNRNHHGEDAGGKGRKHCTSLGERCSRKEQRKRSTLISSPKREGLYESTGKTTQKGNELTRGGGKKTPHNVPSKKNHFQPNSEKRIGGRRKKKRPPGTELEICAESDGNSSAEARKKKGTNGKTVTKIAEEKGG